MRLGRCTWRMTWCMHGQTQHYSALDACSAVDPENSGVPRQHIALKVVTPVHVMGNLNFEAGLCKWELAIVTDQSPRAW